VMRGWSGTTWRRRRTAGIGLHLHMGRVVIASVGYKDVLHKLVEPSLMSN
jgi:hypothetical protein